MKEQGLGNKRGEKMQLLKNSIMKTIFGIILICLLFVETISYASTIESLLQEARNKVVSNDFEGAVAIYDSILKEDPQNLSALNGKARVLSWMGNYDAATGIYKTILSEDPENIESLTGLADVYAWQKDYKRAIELLEPHLKKHPYEKELLIRLSRYYLWEGKKRETLSYSDRILKDNPADKDALEMKRQALSIHNFEYYVGYYYLNINNNVDSHNIYTGIRYKPKEKYLFYGQVDYLDRFREKEGRIMVGGTVPVADKLNASAEVALSPGATIFPIVSGWFELGYPPVPSLVLYGRMNVSHYRDADLYGISVAGEYYPVGYLSLFTRYTLSRTEFDGGKNSTDGAVLVKLTWFINDKNKIFGYFSYGNESYKIETIDMIGGIKAKTYGVGGTYFITPTVGLSPSFEYQDRQRGTQYIQVGLEITFLL